MKTAGKNLNQGSFGQGRAQWGKAFGRSLMASMVLVVGLAGSAQAAPASNPAVA
ncbi:flagellar motor protein MotA, partial [Serratia marcescens]